MKKVLQLLIALLVVIIIQEAGLNAQNKKGKMGDPAVVSGSPSYAKLNINNVSTFVYNDGRSDINTRSDAAFEYPKGSGKYVFYSSGPVIGGVIDGYWGVVGAAYRSALTPGRILSSGLPEDSNSPLVRVYRVRSDYKNFRTRDEMAILYASETADEQKSADEIFAQYELDWNQWPADKGAPFIDKNNNGIYEPAVDIPGVSESPCQTIWCVANDFNQTATNSFYGTLPLKVEVQFTYFAYKAESPFGNTVFRKYRIINKNSKKIDSMYFCMWSDPDNGDAFNDLCGSDSTLNLGYIYNNSDDRIYKTYSPAGGFLMLRTPVVPGSLFDSAYYKDRVIKGVRNLAMTGYFLFSSSVGADYSDPAQMVYAGALHWKNLFRNRLSRSGTPYINPVTGKTTSFMVSGDPVNNSGWLDGRFINTGDRRMGLVSGPFTMNPGDTQETIVAQIAAGAKPGVDRLKAVTLLKYYAKAVQVQYTGNGTNIVTPPAPPLVTASGYDASLLLDWSAAGSYEQCENWGIGKFKFEGYNIYQLPRADSQLKEGIKIGSFDAVNGIRTVVSTDIVDSLGVITNTIRAEGSDTGIYRYIKVSSDRIRGINSLFNGTEYHFAVTAYGVHPDPDAIPNFVESAPARISAVPHNENPGVRFGSASGDSLAVSHSAGSSDGKVIVKVIDPLKGDGRLYRVVTESSEKFSLFRGDTLIHSNLSIKGLSGENPIVAGAQVHVVPPQGKGLKNIIVSGTNPFDISGKNLPIPVFSITEYKGLWSSSVQMGLNWYYTGILSNQAGPGTSLTSFDQYHDIIIKFADTDENGNFQDTSPNASKGYRFVKGAHLQASKTEFIPFISNKLNYGFQDFGLNGKANVPLAAFDGNTGKRLDIAFIEDNSAWGSVNGKYFPSLHTDYATNPSGEILLILATEYGTTAKPELSQSDREIRMQTNYGPIPIMYFIQSGRDKPAFSSSDELLIQAYKQFTATDKFEFTIPAVTNNRETAKEDIARINVFPNPYYGLSPEAMSRAEQRVTFNHLPARATIKIFNISGQLVRVLEKGDTGQFLAWDLKTEWNRDVSSGIYVAHISMPDLGETKVMKFAVFMGQQYPVKY